MRPSTYTGRDKYKWIAILTAVTILTAMLNRHSPLVLLSIFPALGVSLLVMRTRIQRHFARTPVRQVAYVSLFEPIYRDYQEQVGEDEDGRPIMATRQKPVGTRRRDVPLPQQIEPSYVDLLKYIEEKKNPSVLVTGQPMMGKTNLTIMLILKQKAKKSSSPSRPMTPTFSYPTK
jgi:hypothetical protein